MVSWEGLEVLENLLFENTTAGTARATPHHAKTNDQTSDENAKHTEDAHAKTTTEDANAKTTDNDDPIEDMTDGDDDHAKTTTEKDQANHTTSTTKDNTMPETTTSPSAKTEDDEVTLLIKFNILPSGGEKTQTHRSQ